MGENVQKKMILIATIVEGISTRKDKSFKITLGTQELTPSQAAELFDLSSQYCFTALKKEPFQKDEVDLMDSLKTDFESQKTPSQRLRGVLYINYEQNDEGFKDFASYYTHKMDTIINHFKNKLD